VKYSPKRDIAIRPLAEISKLADTNIASVNYHFANKETLYTEAWRCAFHESLKAHPPDGGVSDNAPVEERFRAHVKATIGRLADKKQQGILVCAEGIRQSHRTAGRSNEERN